MDQKEPFSRVVIDRKLREVGWDIEDLRQVTFEDHGNAGRADYVLKDTSGKPIAIIEAKAPNIDPYSAKNQANNYVKLQYPNVDFIYLANDNIIYFWDLGQGDAIPVSSFFSQADLIKKRQSGRLNNVEPLTRKTVDEDYFQNVSDSVNLRPYQIEAWNTVSKLFDKNKREFLLEMATGTGKTVLAALMISKFIRTNNAQTVLFIVDRKQLAMQTKNVFESLLRDIAVVGTYWGSNRKNLTGANVVVATIQSLMIHGKRDFTPGYFDLIIHDEAHRSIYSPEARAAVDYFIATTKVGLTATPKDFLKNIDIDKLAVNDPRALERRIQRDTYKYFGCEDSTPTFRYSIQNGVRDKFLNPPKYHKMNTVLTQQALTDIGITALSDVDLEEGGNLLIQDLEKKVYLPERNKAMLQEFLQYAEKTPNGDVGKTIIFAVSQKHALALEKILNELKPEYNGHFAKTITSNVVGAHEIAKDFARQTSQLPRVAVTVDMLSTGFDCPEILNIVLVRPIFEPVNYQQIKGRGTRLCPEIKKDHFTIYDFCGVVEYFDEKYDWEAPLRDPREIKKGTICPPPTGGTDGPPPPPPPKFIQTSYMADSVLERDEIAFGPEGDTVDRKLYQDAWEKAVNDFVEERKDMIGDLLENPDRVEELTEKIQIELLNKPKHYFNENTLIATYRIIAGVRDFFLAALGKQKLPTRDQQVEEFKQGLINKFRKSEGATMRRTLMVDYLTDQFIQDKDLLQGIQNQPNIKFLANPLFTQAFPTRDWLDEFGKDSLLELVSDISNAKILKV